MRVLAGGLNAYAAEGELFRDVNVPSKGFGELVEAIRGTPSLSAKEVKQLIDERADMVVLDGRRFEEYQAMSLPTAMISVAEWRAGAAGAGDGALLAEKTLVVVNCARDERGGIIGAQTLVNAGIPNRVAALRNGTIGWRVDARRNCAGARSVAAVRAGGAEWARGSGADGGDSGGGKGRASG